MTSSNRPPNKRLFIGSLPYKFTEGELLSLFAPFGRIVALKIMHNQWGKSRGLGFVEFDDLNSAIEAKKQLHNHQLEDRSIIVDFSEPDPFLTPEGQQRHLDAQNRFTRRSPDVLRDGGGRPHSSSTGFKPVDSRPGHIRQSVFNSRHYGSHIGAKFASRTKRKK